MAPTGKPRGRPRKSNSSATTSSSARTSDPLGAFPAPPALPGSFVDSAYGSQPQSQPTDFGEPSKHTSQSQRVPLKPTSPVEARTPIHRHASPTKEGSLRMTAAQKQALIDNLRLESEYLPISSRLPFALAAGASNLEPRLTQLTVTERARRLRSQYAQSAASLRRRLEMRIHRVPAALRRLTMGEVIERHEQKVKAEAEAKARRAKEAEEEEQRRAELEAQKVEAAKKKTAPPPAKQTRAAKRSSDELDTTTVDKENSVQPPISNKRARPAPAVRAPSAAKPAAKSNTTARRAPPSTATHPPPREVLSPKSHNSRAYPASPFKSPSKPVMSRPTSPLKPSVQVSPSKPVTIPANVPAVANVGTASSMAKTKPTTGTASRTGTVRGPPAGSTRAASRAGTAGSTARCAAA